MTAVEINGGNVEYELHGPDQGQRIVLTPGGRFSKEVPGLRPLADELVNAGMRVLLWDRPNCGASDVQFTGQSESHMRADTLAGLLEALDFAPAVIAGGSGGSRDSILTVMRHPEVATKLIVWNIVGGVFGSISLAGVYNTPSIRAAQSLGMDAVIAMPEWQALIEGNPRNLQRLQAISREEFLKVMLRWMNAFVPKPGQTIPGVEDEEFEKIQVPTMIIRGGADDWDHPKRTSLEVHCLIRQSQLVEPPWPEDAWERAVEARAQGRGNIFDPWVKAAPLILDFVGK